MTTGPTEAKPSWEWAVKNWWQVLLIVALILAITILLFLWVLGGSLAFPTPAKDSTVASFNLAVGSYLIQWGIALTIAAFVPALLLAILGGFQISAATGGGGVRPAAEGPFSALLGAIPVLLKVPGGFGILLILIGAAISTGTAFTGAEVMASPAASP